MSKSNAVSKTVAAVVGGAAAYAMTSPHATPSSSTIEGAAVGGGLRGVFLDYWGLKGSDKPIQKLAGFSHVAVLVVDLPLSVTSDAHAEEFLQNKELLQSMKGWQYDLEASTGQTQARRREWSETGFKTQRQSDGVRVWVGTTTIDVPASESTDPLQIEALRYAAKYPKYNMLTNNCLDYATSLAKVAVGEEAYRKFGYLTGYRKGGLENVWIPTYNDDEKVMPGGYQHKPAK